MLNLLGAKIYGYSLRPEKKSLFIQSNCSKLVKKNIYSDIKNRKKLNRSILKIKPEIIFHLAAQPLVTEGYKNPIETFNTNITGTINILNTITKCKSLKSAVIITTDKVYKNTNTLRYGKVLILTDQDHDGSHIKGLFINFIHSACPS